MDATSTPDGAAAVPVPIPLPVAEHVALLERAKLGDRSAVAELVLRFGPLVERTARRHTRSASDADDVAHEVWLTCVSRLGTIHTPACLPGWLAQVTKRAAIKLARSRPSLVPLDAVPEAADSRAETDEVVERMTSAACRASVRSALRRLPEADSDLLQRLFADERPNYTAVSSAVQRPVGSLGPTRGRLLARLGRDPSIARLASA